MRRVIILTLCFLFVFLTVDFAFSAVVVVKEKEVVLKASPQGKDIGMVTEGVTCEKIEEEGEWIKVKLEGWIKANEVIVLKTDMDKDKDKDTKTDKEYIELTAKKLRLQGIMDTYENKKVSFDGNFEGIFESNKEVVNYANFTVSSVECYINTKDYNKIKDLKRDDSVHVYGTVKRGLRWPPWYYLRVDEIVKQ
ncbi:MAG: hypothetical protein ABH868_04095 [bacterium]